MSQYREVPFISLRRPVRGFSPSACRQDGSSSSQRADRQGHRNTRQLPSAKHSQKLLTGSEIEATSSIARQSACLPTKQTSDPARGQSSGEETPWSCPDLFRPRVTKRSETNGLPVADLAAKQRFYEIQLLDTPVRHLEMQVPCDTRLSAPKLPAERGSITDQLRVAPHVPVEVDPCIFRTRFPESANFISLRHGMFA